MPAQTFDAGAGNLTLRFHRGDEFAAHMRITYRDSGLPIDLEGYSLSAWASLFDTDEVVAEFDLRVVDAAAGLLSLSLTEDETADLDAGSYRWRLKWIAPNDVGRTILRGVCEVLDERRAA
jgi:hypothetical protein